MRCPTILRTVVILAAFSAVASGANRRIEVLLDDSERTFSIDVQDVPLNVVLRMLSKQHDMSIITAQDVDTVVSARFHEVTLAEALNSLVTINGYAYRIKDSLIEVYSPQPGEDPKADRASVRVFKLNFANPDNVKPLIQPFLSEPTGKIESDATGNLLIVYDLPGVMKTIEHVIEKVDQPEPQVIIGAEIIEATIDIEEKLGVDWRTRVSATGSARPITWPFRRGRSGNSFLPGNQPLLEDFAPDLSFPLATPEDFTFGTLDATGLRMVLDILKTDSGTNLIANPEITTLNNHEAKISIGSTVPVPIFTTNLETNVSAVTGFEEVDIGTILTVLPQINEEAGIIRMVVRPEISEILGFKGQFDERPIIGQRRAETTVRLKDGETLVIGGLVSEKNEETVNKIPILGDIPLLGWLFKSRAVEKTKTSLYIFITPRIITTARYEGRTTDAAKRLLRDGLGEYNTGADDLRESPDASPFNRARRQIEIENETELSPDD